MVGHGGFAVGGVGGRRGADQIGSGRTKNEVSECIASWRKATRLVEAGMSQFEIDSR